MAAVAALAAVPESARGIFSGICVIDNVKCFSRRACCVWCGLCTCRTRYVPLWDGVSTRAFAVHLSSGGFCNTSVGIVANSIFGWLAVVGETDGLRVGRVAGRLMLTRNGREESDQAKKDGERLYSTTQDDPFRSYLRDVDVRWFISG